MKNFSINVVKNADEALLLFDSLLNFLSPSQISAPSLQLYWLSAFIRNYGWNRRLAITIISEEDKPRLIAPLQCVDEENLIFLCDETADYNDFIFNNSSPDIILVKLLLDFWLSKGVKKIKLDRLPSDSLTLKILQTIAKDNNLNVLFERCDKLPVVITQADKPIEAWEGVKLKWIKGYQRSMMRLNKRADITFSLVETDNELETIFPIIRNVYTRRWQSHNIPSKYLDKKRDLFITEICNKALETNSLFLPIMKIDGVIAAYRIGFRGGNTIFDWNTSFALEFSKWSPGALLMLFILSNANEWKFSKYNLMRGEEQYKYIWTDKAEQTISASIT